ncbi:hypothetical protein, partial [Metabacillus niabensis]|uniref:hypothetical protein n=1 Tax=Metabacillus niabensis TaxID=324854 RepID=UPI001C2E94DB
NITMIPTYEKYAYSIGIFYLLSSLSLEFFKFFDYNQSNHFDTSLIYFQQKTYAFTIYRVSNQIGGEI